MPVQFSALAYARLVLDQGGDAYALFDQRIFEIALQEEEFAEQVTYGGVKRAATLEEAAAAFGLLPEAVAEEVAAHSAAATGQAPDRYGRRDLGLAPLQGPFYIARVVPGLFHTQGGLSVAQKEALRLADNRIAENATWDQALLRDALAVVQAAPELDLAALGFSAAELRRLVLTGW